MGTDGYDEYGRHTRVHHAGSSRRRVRRTAGRCGYDEPVPLIQTTDTSTHQLRTQLARIKPNSIPIILVERTQYRMSHR